MPRKRRGGSLGRLTPNAKRIKVTVTSQTSDQKVSDQHTSDPKTSDLTAREPQTSAPSNNSLPLHLQSAEFKDKSPFKCPICNKVFTRNSSLQRHLLTHTIDKNVEKNTENSNNSTLKQLQIDETKYKSLFLCTYCEQKFSRKDNFDRHVKSHIQKENDIYNYIL